MLVHLASDNCDPRYGIPLLFRLALIVHILTRHVKINYSLQGYCPLKMFPKKGIYNYGGE